MARWIRRCSDVAWDGTSMGYASDSTELPVSVDCPGARLKLTPCLSRLSPLPPFCPPIIFHPFIRPERVLRIGALNIFIVIALLRRSTASHNASPAQSHVR